MTEATAWACTFTAIIILNTIGMVWAVHDGACAKSKQERRKNIILIAISCVALGAVASAMAAKIAGA